MGKQDSARPPSFYLNFKSLIFCADRISDMRQKENFLRIHGDFLQKALQALNTAEDWVSFAVVQRVLAAETENQPVPVFPFSTSKERCGALEKYQAEILGESVRFAFERAEKLLECAKNPRYAEPDCRNLYERDEKNSFDFLRAYLDRHRCAEKAIRLLWELTDDNDNWPYSDILPAEKIYTLLAEIYLQRSRLVLPKGSSIPEKKSEAIENAGKWAAKITENKELRAEIELEKLKWDKNYPESKSLDFFQDFFSQKKFRFNAQNPLHRDIHERFPRLGHENQPDFDKKLLELPPDQHLRLPLLQVRAALRRGEADIGKRLDTCVEKLVRKDKKPPLSLVNPLWEDTTETIGRAAAEKQYKGQWEEATVRAWKYCQNAEENLFESFRVRWYWSRQRELYNLAFRAALNKDDREKALEIADAVKSRPVMKILDMERTFPPDLQDKLKKKLLEMDAQDFNDSFIVGAGEVKKTKQKSRKGRKNKKSQYPKAEKRGDQPADKSSELPGNKKDSRPFSDLPAGWSAVHFYITDLENAHALIVRKGRIQIREIGISELWYHFSRWEDARREADHMKDICFPFLKNLCEACGQMLEPVLDITGNDPLIFIPHGFMHMLPLHAARAFPRKSRLEKFLSMKKAEKEYLFESRSCLFLPAWSLAPLDNSSICESGADILHSNWTSRKDIENELDAEDRWDNEKRENNSPEDVFRDIRENCPLRFYALFCHGQGDMHNPYHARFLLHGDALDYQQIGSDLPRTDGARVLLTACETDLVSGSRGPADEHLSLAAAFLHQGAVETAGTLFKCNPEFSVALLDRVKNEVLHHPRMPLHEILRKFQTEYSRKNPEKLHCFIPFRVMGFPS